MIYVNNYVVQNGTRSKPFTINKELKNKKELELLRKGLEEKHHCISVDLFNKKKRTSSIFFVFREK